MNLKRTAARHKRVNYGDEPINNHGRRYLTERISTESKFLTSMVDQNSADSTRRKYPMSAVQAEAAKLIPGHSRAVGREGNSYIDDFEGSQSTIDLRSLGQ